MADHRPKARGGEPLGVIGFAETLRRLFHLLGAARRRQFYGLLGLMLLGAAAELFLIAAAVPFLALLAGSADQGAIGPLGKLLELAGTGRDRLIGTIAPLFIAAVLIATVIRLLLSWMKQRFVVGVGHDLAVEAQRRILLQPYSFHVARNTSESIASLDKIQVLVLSVLQQTMTSLVAIVMAVFILGMLLTVDAVAAVAAVVVISLSYWLIARITAARLARNSRVFGTAYDQRIKMVQESLGGIRDLIIDQTQPVFLEEFRRVDRRFARAGAVAIFIAGAPRFLLEGIALVFIAALAVLLSGGDGGLGRALPVLGAIALGGLRLLPLVQQAFASWATLAANRSVIAQVLELLALPVPAGTGAGTALPFDQAIRLNDVTYAYPGRRDPVVDGLSLAIERGERIGLAGETGSGKSTLADLLMGLLQPRSGTIEVDGVALDPGNVSAWQRNIAHVSQTIFLADASIARNIAFSAAEGGTDMDRVRRAAAQAEIAGFIDDLPDGYETIVGERGVRLSGGQRQRIAIARALYKDAPLLVLDEATNALDRKTEAKLLSNLFTDRQRTILVIAHRQSALTHCDRVLELRDGRLVMGAQAAARSQ